MKASRHMRVVASSDMASTATVESATVLQLVAQGYEYRDGWIPVSGRIDSGFTTPVPPVAQDRLLVDALSISSRDLYRARIELERVANLGVSVIPFNSQTYPGLLRDLNGRPSILYVRGHCEATNRPVLAIAGSRRATPEGRSVAYRVARAVSGAGHLVVSGLAAGIDSCAHKGALDASGMTLAVMGTGIDVVFPKSNAGLAHRIRNSGALISQFPPGQEPTKTSFPARNAVIAGFAHVSLLVEMSENSGSMIEANCALRQGRPTLLWGPLLSRHAWARSLVTDRGAHFVGSVEEILMILKRCSL
jgi:DNA processing protein